MHYASTTVVGAVALLSALINILSTVFSLSINSGTSHFIAFHTGSGNYGSARKVIRTSLALSTVMSVISLLFMLIASSFISITFFHSYAYSTIIKLVGFELSLNVMNMTLVAVLNGLQRFRVYSSINILAIGINYGLSVLIYIITGSLFLLVLAWVLAYFIQTLLLSIKVFGIYASLNNGKGGQFQTSSLIYYSFPLFLSAVIGTGATYIDRLIVTFFLSLSELGVYNLSLLISTSLSFIISPVTAIMFPKLSKIFGTGNIDYIKFYVSKAITVVMALYVPIAFIVSALSQSIILFISRQDYLPGYLPVMIISITSSITISSSIIGISLQSVRKTNIFIISSLLALLSNFLLSMILIPELGIVGAAVGFSSINIVSFLMFFYFGKKYSVLSFEKGKLLKIMLSAAITFSALLEIQNYAGYSPIKLVGLLLLGIVLYSSMILITKAFDSKDFSLYSSLLPEFDALIKAIGRVFAR